MQRLVLSTYLKKRPTTGALGPWPQALTTSTNSVAQEAVAIAREMNFKSLVQEVETLRQKLTEEKSASGVGSETTALLKQIQSEKEQLQKLMIEIDGKKQELLSLLTKYQSAKAILDAEITKYQSWVKEALGSCPLGHPREQDLTSFIMDEHHRFRPTPPPTAGSPPIVVSGYCTPRLVLPLVLPTNTMKSSSMNMTSATSVSSTPSSPNHKTEL